MFDAREQHQTDGKASSPAKRATDKACNLESVSLVFCRVVLGITREADIYSRGGISGVAIATQTRGC